MITDKKNQKYESLKNYIKDKGKVCIAFSGGVDSAFLLKVSKDVLDRDVLAITVDTDAFPKSELSESIYFCKEYDIKHIVVPFDVLSVDEFKHNRIDRCYFCKKQIFGLIKDEAKKYGIDTVFDGSNYEDKGVYRPGLKAKEELGIISPLMDFEMSKDEIRYFSKKLGLKTYDKPSISCLATRFEYDCEISKDKLEMVSNAEDILKDLGFKQVRVRVHESIARIEIYPSDFSKILNDDIRYAITTKLKNLGFMYVTLDLSGFKSGSMDLNISK